MKVKGLVHIYYGKGKGKTCSALGQALRALGQGWCVIIFQFLKDEKAHTGEFNALKGLKNIRFRRYKQIHPMFKQKITENFFKRLKKEVSLSLRELREALQGKYDLVIADELLNLAEMGLISSKEIISLIEDKADNVEFIITGRKLPKGISIYAHYLTEFRARKHPFNAGIKARKGIEY